MGRALRHAALLFFIADEIALLTYGLRTIGLPDGLIMPLSAPSFPFIIFPLGGVLYLISWAWRKNSRTVA